MNVYVRELTRVLTRRGLHTDIFTLWHDGLDTQDVRFDNSNRLIHIDVGEGNLSKEDTIDALPQFADKVLDFIERNDLEYDVIHSHYWLSSWVGERLKSRLETPHVTTFHTLGRVKERAKPGHREPEPRKLAESQAVSSTERIIVSTIDERDDLADLYDADPNKIKMIPPGVDLSLFQPMDMAEARANLGINASKVLLFVGRLDPLKGVDILLHAFSRLRNERDIHLVVVGGNVADHDEETRLKDLTRELGIADRVDFRGPVDHDMLHLLYSTANVTVVPSYHESFGLVAVESLACGTPVVASNRGGLSTTIIDGENGFLVDELSAEAFSAPLARLLDDEELEARLRANSRSSVRKYSWDAVGAAIQEEYQTLRQATCSYCC
jgi:D-inositol-3-phosphate glycosyltransferase